MYKSYFLQMVLTITGKSFQYMATLTDSMEPQCSCNTKAALTNIAGNNKLYLLNLKDLIESIYLMLTID
jgi:hypothetical protein